MNNKVTEKMDNFGCVHIKNPIFGITEYTHVKITPASFLARDVIYTSRAYATMSVSVCLSVCL